MKYNLHNIIYGALIYAGGDSIAALMMHEFTIVRMVGMMLIGATFYAFEIPNYFFWISKSTAMFVGMKASLLRTGLALLYFNPLWIARHLFFIKIFMGKFEEVNARLLSIALMSFVVNIPVSLIANYIIQNKIRVGMRFIASAIFSGLMAIYYAMSTSWF